ncbi:TIGR04063 family PEP-CTERM/XrtA system glycosyltransferase [Brumicola nitratireducens]|uniref:Membrane-anchored group 1 glycosyltransferase n=1 Tax=Glaciecola nitratireducens (strain JCM 12485 / KCTC 12276 / FR1064) TaxID=1085623 RepID=G4QI43_GLANF|nr:TIGR04063 family PEP-CTERM/XrtA system glycosyltransferase [Glaciecola nitratireducens]AEP30657.1 membrane-anchored group 1 glycosyltransferase [Glaciecola nitratireducens FR1064]
MKVLHVLDHSIPLHSGYTFRTKAILEQQHGFGIDTVHVTSAKQGDFSTNPETIDELIFYRSEVPTGFFSKLPLIGQMAIISSLKKSLVKVIKTENPDIIHAHSPSLNGVAANWAAKKFGIPFVYEIRAFWEDAAVDHGTCKEGDLRYRLTRAMESNVVKNADAVTVICQGLKDDLIARGVASSKITLIPNAVELDKFIHRTPDESAKQALRDKLNMGDAFVLGFIGSFYAYEGLDILVRAMHTLASSDKPFSLLLVGGGPQDANLKALAKELKVEDKIIFTGRVAHAEVANYYDLVDLLVFPRKSMRLTELVTPLKPLEAMAQKKLVLASDVGGHKELIEDGSNGYLFAADDEKELAEKIIEISGKEHAGILDNGLSFVKEVRNWKVSVSNYLPIYERLTGKKVQGKQQ